MWKASLCTVCKKGHMMLTGKSLYEFECNNPDCKTRIIDVTLCERTEKNENLESEQNRDIK